MPKKYAHHKCSYNLSLRRTYYTLGSIEVGDNSQGGSFPVGGKMASVRRSAHTMRKGAVLIISMIFVLVFSALAVSMASISGTNLQLASNQHELDLALASAESGLEVMRYWHTRVTIPNTTVQSDYFSTIVNSVQNDLAANNISNITVNNDGSIAPVTLQTASGQTFTGQIAIQAGQPNIV